MIHSITDNARITRPFLSKYQGKLTSSEELIVFFSPNDSYFSREFISGMRTCLTTYMSYVSFTSYWGDNNDIADLKRIAQRIIKEKVGIVFTIGPATTKIMMAAAAEALHKPEIIFVGPHPETIPATLSVTGIVQTPYDYAKQISLFKKLTLNRVDRVLLVSTALCQQYTADEIFKATDVLKKEFTKTHVAILNDNDDVATIIAPYLTEIDFIMMPRDNLSTRHLNDLIDLCIDHKKPLLGSSLRMADEGAAIVFGRSDYDDGYQASELIYPHFAQNIPCRDITPQTLIDRSFIGLNRITMSLQGFEINADALKEKLEYPVILR